VCDAYIVNAFLCAEYTPPPNNTPEFSSDESESPFSPYHSVIDTGGIHNSVSSTAGSSVSDDS